MMDEVNLPKGELPPPRMDEAIHFIGDLQRCDVKPGDRFVLTVERPISRATHELIQKVWREFIGSDNPAKLLVLEDGMRLGIMGAGRDDDLRTEAAFLLDRLAELDFESSADEIYRDFAGHCEPSIARLRTLLQAEPT